MPPFITRQMWTDTLDHGKPYVAESPRHFETFLFIGKKKKQDKTKNKLNKPQLDILLFLFELYEE